MEIDKMTIGEVRAISALFTPQPPAPHPYTIGANYFIRTVTHHHTGRLLEVLKHELVLDQASWIADDGRLTDSLRTSVFNEVEMFPPGRLIIGRGSIIDACEIEQLPKEQK
jgi:hypothetical protein